MQGQILPNADAVGSSRSSALPGMKHAVVKQYWVESNTRWKDGVCSLEQYCKPHEAVLACYSSQRASRRKEARKRNGEDRESILMF